MTATHDHLTCCRLQQSPSAENAMHAAGFAIPFRQAARHTESHATGKRTSEEVPLAKPFTTEVLHVRAE
jgi:hypothetical protein